MKQLPKESNGFIKNPNGKGWYYTEEAAIHFLTTNKLTHLIRTHEGGKLHEAHFSLWLMNDFIFDRTSRFDVLCRFSSNDTNECE